MRELVRFRFRRIRVTLGEAMVFCLALGFLFGLVWVRSLDEPTGGTVPEIVYVEKEVTEE